MFKHRPLTIAALLTLITILPTQAQTPPPSDRMTTPQLIDAALDRGEIDQSTANLYLAYALTDYDRVPEQYRGNAPWHGTLPLLRLREATERMRPSTLREIILKMLAGICHDSTGSLPFITNSTHFHVQYVTIGGGLSISDYTTSLETAWTTEITTFGWAAPPVLTSNPPPGNRYHVRIIDDLDPTLHGYVSSSGTHAGLVGDNPNTAWNDVDAYASCMVLTNDYTTSYITAQQALDATVAHELNHSIQFGYGALSGSNRPDEILIEGGAKWMEDEVFDSANKNHYFLWPTFDMCLGEYTDNPYLYWITFRGLTERYGTGSASAGEQVMQDFWESTSQSSTSNMLTALNSALVSKGTTLPQAYHAYAIAVNFNKTCGGGYTLPHCFEEASGYVGAAGSTSVHGSIASVGGSYTGSIQDYFALNWISLPSTGAPYAVTLENTSSGGQLRGSVVCDNLSALNVHPLPTVVGAGQATSLLYIHPALCSSVVFVLTNEGGTSSNPSSCTARSYRINAWLVDEEVHLPLVMRTYATPLLNGGFEAGPTGWTEYSTHGYDLILHRSALPENPHGGDWAAWLGGGNDETSYIEQSVAIQAGTPYLAYYHWINSSDLCGYDYGGVIINGSTVVDVYDLCSATNTGGWVKHVVNLSAYAGQTVALQIRVETDYSNVSSLLVDDVAFQASPSREQGERGPADIEDTVPWSRPTIHRQPDPSEGYLFTDHTP